MMAIESLIAEHQIIARVAAALETYAGRLRRGEPVDEADLARFAHVFTDFAECIHHEKEENLLLPMLSRQGWSWDSGVLPAIRREHRQEAYLIDVLRQAGERARSWHSEDRRHIAAAALGLVEFQRSHHLLESKDLFPAVELRLNEAQQAELERAFLRFDREHDQRRASALSLAEALIERYAPGPPALARPEPEAEQGLPDDPEGSECCTATVEL
jgi:hemerythrin-like domain-containing protein